MKRALERLMNWHFAPALIAISVATMLAWLALVLHREPGESKDTFARPKPANSSTAAVPASTPAAPSASVPAASARANANAKRPDTSGSLDANGSLLAALRTDDIALRIDAVRAARDRAPERVLPTLLALDVNAEPELAPALISTIASLARTADPTLRDDAARRLGEWLRGQVARDDAAARGNVSLLVDKLAKLDSPTASAALADALVQGQVPIHVATLAVQGLARYGDASQIAAIERFRERVVREPVSSDFERELQRESLHATERALATLARERKPG